MLKVMDMPEAEMRSLLARIGFGHLGCARDGRPYVLPMHYAYDAEHLYLFTTEGTKTEYINANPEVCLQVEEIESPENWRSVMVTGRAERVTAPAEMERAMQVLTGAHPSLSPAINKTQIDAWGRANVTVIYRIRPEMIDGRRTVSEEESDGR